MDLTQRLQLEGRFFRQTAGHRAQQGPRDFRHRPSNRSSTGRSHEDLITTMLPRVWAEGLAAAEDHS